MPAATWLRAWKDFLAPKLHRIAEFLVSQGIATVGSMFYGITCIRLLPLDQYAQFVVVFAIQGSLVVLMDAGISGSIIPLVGERVNDLQLIADYIASLRQLAHRLFAFVTVLTIFVYPMLVRHQHWSPHTVAAMIAIVLVSTWFARVSSAYASVLILLRDRRAWYRIQMIASLGTLALLGIFTSLHCLNAFIAILINVCGVIWSAFACFVRARGLLRVTGKASREKCTAIIQLTLPSVPSVVLYAIQGQLSVMLITIFGRTAAVASIGALGRFRQIFILAPQINAIFVQPYFARLPRAKLKFNYFTALVTISGCCAAILVVVRLFPGFFLWIIGPKYAGLQTELVLVVASGAISTVGSVINTINGARRFVYYSFVLTDNILTLVVQAIFISNVDLSTIKGVLWFGIISTVPTVVINIATAIFGFMRGGRRIIGIDYHAEADQA